jgi:hypothetical protein
MKKVSVHSNRKGKGVTDRLIGWFADPPGSGTAIVSYVEGFLPKEFFAGYYDDIKTDLSFWPALLRRPQLKPQFETSEVVLFADTSRGGFRHELISEGVCWQHCQLWHIGALIDRYRAGERGVLLSNGRANYFSTSDCYVVVSNSKGVWHVGTIGYGGEVYFNRGDRFFALSPIGWL